MNLQAHPHQEQPIKAAGTILQNATAAMIMIHGRGGSADDIILMTSHFNQPDFAYLAPQAADYSWYPNRFVAPVESNEPYLSSALRKVYDLVRQVETAGIAAEKIMLLGFSQGACLALEYAARHSRRFGGVIAYSGGLIGDVLDESRYVSSLQNTPIFIGCSDVDFHIPLQRVQESSRLLEKLGADVTTRIYPGMGHTINQDEVDFTRALMQTLL